MDLKVWSISKPPYDLKNVDLKVWIIPWYRSIILVKNHSSMDSLYFDIVPPNQQLFSISKQQVQPVAFGEQIAFGEQDSIR